MRVGCPFKETQQLSDRNPRDGRGAENEIISFHFNVQRNNKEEGRSSQSLVGTLLFLLLLCAPWGPSPGAF
jgi:hypothetical protein